MSNSHVLTVFASIVFVLHIAGNLFAVRPTPEALDRLRNIRELSLFPPNWVFSIWLVIWVLQSVMLVQTFGSSFWSVTATTLFVVTCAGNLGSQVAGAQNAPWFVYLGCLGSMLIAAFAFMLQATPSSGMTAPGIWASQLYVGWASLAFLVGSGVILVRFKSIISDSVFTVFGLTLVILVPIAIWLSWAIGKADYRIVSIPYGVLIFAFFVRRITMHAAIR